jgi:hypothetical protein
MVLQFHFGPCHLRYELYTPTAGLFGAVIPNFYTPQYSYYYYLFSHKPLLLEDKAVVFEDSTVHEVCRHLSIVYC